MYVDDSVTRCHFRLVPMFFRTALSHSGDLLLGEGWLQLHDAAGVICRKCATADIKAQVPSNNNNIFY